MFLGICCPGTGVPGYAIPRAYGTILHSMRIWLNRPPLQCRTASTRWDGKSGLQPIHQKKWRGRGKVAMMSGKGVGMEVELLYARDEAVAQALGKLAPF
jgi:hypothetical protein